MYLLCGFLFFVPTSAQIVELSTSPTILNERFETAKWVFLLNVILSHVCEIDYSTNFLINYSNMLWICQVVDKTWNCNI